MTPKQIDNLIALALANFPSYQGRDMRPTQCLWQELLGDLDYELALAAVQKVLLSSDFWPTVAQIRQAAVELTRPPSLTFDEAWAQVKAAIARHGTWDERAALAMLDPHVAEVATNFGWRDICLSEETDVVRGQFRMAWEAHERRRHDLARLPAPLRDRMDGRRRLSLSGPTGLVPLAELAREE